MNCIKCGAEIPDGAKFCNFCGVKQDLICANCGAALPNGVRFCHVCGSPTQSKTEPEPTSDPYADLEPYADLDNGNSAGLSDAPAEEKVSEKDVAKEDGWNQINKSLERVNRNITVLPNKQNFEKLFEITGRVSYAEKGSDGMWTLGVVLRWANEYTENTDPDYHCYGCFSIISKKDGQVIPGLEDLMAYTLSGHGIYYVTQRAGIWFMGSDGAPRRLGGQKNVISLHCEGDVLTVTYVKSHHQVAYNEHCDVPSCGDVWFNGYELETGEVTFRRPPDLPPFPPQPKSAPKKAEQKLAPKKAKPKPAPPKEVLPNKQNFEKLFQIVGRKSTARKLSNGTWQLYVQLRHNDDYRKYTDPDYHCYGCFSIIKKDTDPKHHYTCDADKGGYYIRTDTYWSGGSYTDKVPTEPVVPALKDLMAYALSDRGIYFVTQEGKICFLGADGNMQVLGNQKNVISLHYEAGVLRAAYVKKRSQFEYNEHHDENGGYDEAWYDGYDLEVGEVAIRHTP